MNVIIGSFVLSMCKRPRNWLTQQKKIIMMCGDGHSAKTFLKKKLESKSKKKLKFLDKDKSE